MSGPERREQSGRMASALAFFVAGAMMTEITGVTTHLLCEAAPRCPEALAQQETRPADH
jgi:hypothetical protein